MIKENPPNIFYQQMKQKVEVTSHTKEKYQNERFDFQNLRSQLGEAFNMQICNDPYTKTQKPFL